MNISETKSSNNQERYVKTPDIKEAVKGHETEVLSAIGINLNGKHSHIKCPYPDHDDTNPSWRWDEKESVSFCSCSQGINIFDVTAKVTGMNFDSAKMHVAEIIGRSDLICIKGQRSSEGKNRKRVIKSDAKSLLNPPADARDDEIPVCYLASRLDVESNKVPMPTTSTVGITGLDYWVVEEEKPRSIGQFPCAVFQTKDRSGKTHAQRIYLSENWKAKADLGKGNDVKKSAKAKKGDKTTGRSVIWGNIEKSPTTVLCEGIETGCALAYRLAKEIEAGDIAVAAAISTNGIKGFHPWPCTLNVIVAADRDEGEKGSFAGEKAARIFCSRNRNQIDVAIALPGNQGEKCDFLDMHLTDGKDDILSRILDAEPFVPTPEEEAEREVINLEIGSDVEIATRLKERLLEQCGGNVVGCEGALWRYNSQIWERISDTKLRIEVHTFDGAKYPGDPGIIKLGQGKINSIINELLTIFDEPIFFAEAPVGINCMNGFIRFDNDEGPSIEAHSPDHRARYVIAGNWPDAVCDEQWSSSLLAKLLSGAFLGDSDAGDKVNLIAEITAAAALGCATRLLKPKAIVFKGITAENGKSQILDLMRGFLPPDAVSALPLSKLGEDRYACHLVGKQLNASDELSSASAVASDAFKAIITGEPITARDVYRSAVTFRPVAQHVFATNELPSFKGGMDRGVQRRLLIVTFNRTIPEDERIEHIGSRIAKEEMDLLLNWVVDGASRLLKQRYFTEPASAKDALREWLHGSDPVLAWLEYGTDIVLGEEAPRVLSRDAYMNFKDWAINEGYSERNLPYINVFTRRILAAGKGVTHVRSGGRFLVGLRLRTSSWSASSYSKNYG